MVGEFWSIFRSLGSMEGSGVVLWRRVVFSVGWSRADKLSLRASSSTWEGGGSVPRNLKF